MLHVVEHFPEDRSNEEIAPEDADPKTYREERAKTLLMEIAQDLGNDNAVQAVRFTTQSAKHKIVSYARWDPPRTV